MSPIPFYSGSMEVMSKLLLAADQSMEQITEVGISEHSC